MFWSEFLAIPALQLLHNDFLRCDQDTKPVAPVLGQDEHLERRAQKLSKRLEHVVTNDQDLLQAKGCIVFSHYLSRYAVCMLSSRHVLDVTACRHRKQFAAQTKKERRVMMMMIMRMRTVNTKRTKVKRMKELVNRLEAEAEVVEEEGGIKMPKLQRVLHVLLPHLPKKWKGLQPVCKQKKRLMLKNHQSLRKKKLIQILIRHGSLTQTSKLVVNWLIHSPQEHGSPRVSGEAKFGWIGCPRKGWSKHVPPAWRRIWFLQQDVCPLLCVLWPKYLKNSIASIVKIESSINSSNFNDQCCLDWSIPSQVLYSESSRKCSIR